MKVSENTRSFVATFLVLLNVCACTSKTKSATYTVDEYLARPDVMEKKLQECANNPADLASDPDCINVKAAARRRGLESSLRDLPPMGLPPSTQGNRTGESGQNAGASDRR